MLGPEIKPALTTIANVPRAPPRSLPNVAVMMAGPFTMEHRSAHGLKRAKTNQCLEENRKYAKTRARTKNQVAPV